LWLAHSHGKRSKEEDPDKALDLAQQIVEKYDEETAAAT
jgi:hypothetical protein